MLSSSSGNVSEQESKVLLESWMEHIKSVQDVYPFNVVHDYEGLKAELRKFDSNSTHSKPVFDDYYGDKVGHVIGGFVLYAGENYISPEYYFYSSAKPNHRLACTLNMVLKKHILERLIERMNLKTFEEFKAAIFNVIAYPTMMSTIDQQQVGVTTNYIVVSKDFTLITDIEDGVTTFITMVTSNEYFPDQVRVIEYMLNKVGQDFIGITSDRVPESITIADRVLVDTEVRMDSASNYDVEGLLLMLDPNF